MSATLTEAEYNTERVWAFVILAIVVVIFASIVLSIFLLQRTSQQHQRTTRDYQVACVKTGKLLVRGDCLPVSKP